ncbi:MAG: 8-amino-7-oxononanoate synthase [Natrialbaceae archaeon]|jgi:8-amino-7-oxononanoate synthase
MTDRGFDLDDRVADGDGIRLTPADHVGARATFAPDPDGGLPVLDSEAVLVFASHNYLGLATDERVQEAATAAVDVVGTGAGAPRPTVGDTMVHWDLERLLADVHESDRALTFSSGYAANVGAIVSLAPDVVFVDEHVHAGIVDGIHLAGAEPVRYDHLDPYDLRERMADRTDRSRESWLVATQSVFAADGMAAPIRTLCEVAEQYGAWVMVDEGLATGLYRNGGGVVQAEDVADRVHVQTGSLAKALASQGGFVAGSSTLVDHLTRTARPFVESAGLAPPAAAAASEALHVSRQDDVRDRLWSNVQRLRDGLRSMGYDVLGESQVVPIDLDDPRTATELEAAVRDHGVVVAAEPPTPPGPVRGRVLLTPMATHSPADIQTCLDACYEAGHDLGLL